jgi:hypothetical protein
MEFSNSEILGLTYSGLIKEGTVIENQEGNQMIVCGRSFEIYGSNNKNGFVGFCTGDKWVILD